MYNAKHSYEVVFGIYNGLYFLKLSPPMNQKVGQNLKKGVYPFTLNPSGRALRVEARTKAG